MISCNKILTVDPGVFTMGACLWDQIAWYSNFTCFPEKVVDVVIKEHDRKSLDPMVSMNNLVQRLRLWFENNSILECYCEKPQFFASAKGFAAGIKGHILQLEMFRGMLYTMCQDFNTQFIDVPVLKWKGQLSKQKVVDRIKEIFVLEGARMHLVDYSKIGNDWDACGIGLFIQGVFK